MPEKEEQTCGNCGNCMKNFSRNTEAGIDYQDRCAVSYNLIYDEKQCNLNPSQWKIAEG